MCSVLLAKALVTIKRKVLIFAILVRARVRLESRREPFLAISLKLGAVPIVTGGDRFLKAFAAIAKEREE